MLCERIVGHLGNRTGSLGRLSVRAVVYSNRMSDDDLHEHDGAPVEDHHLQESAADVAAIVSAAGAVGAAGFAGISAYADMQMLRLERERLPRGYPEGIDLEPGLHEPLALEPRESLDLSADWDWPSRY